MSVAVMTTNLPFPVRRGKVRDVYDIGDGKLLIVATDRISAFDCVMPNGIPGKGKILTALSAFWFEFFKGQVDHHLISTNVRDFPKMRNGSASAADLAGRTMLVKKTEVVPVECVARGYLAGSAWAEYQRAGTVCGIALPRGLAQCQKLPEPLFTPATKAESGHDDNIDYETVAARFGEPLARDLRDRTLNLYRKAADYASKRGVIIADTKFEFGLLPASSNTQDSALSTQHSSSLILIDEILTPDSSRFWPADEYEPGRDQPSFDKQFVRNWLEAQDWNKQPPAPELPIEVVWGTRQRYLDAYQKLTGKTLALD
jgi:phosphoribosylaminoimidazole-succinocarboxamide synthase